MPCVADVIVRQVSGVEAFYRLAPASPIMSRFNLVGVVDPLSPEHVPLPVWLHEMRVVIKKRCQRIRDAKNVLPWWIHGQSSAEDDQVTPHSTDCTDSTHSTQSTQSTLHTPQSTHRLHDMTNTPDSTDSTGSTDSTHSTLPTPHSTITPHCHNQ